MPPGHRARGSARARAAARAAACWRTRPEPRPPSPPTRRRDPAGAARAGTGAGRRAPPPRRRRSARDRPAHGRPLRSEIGGSAPRREDAVVGREVAVHEVLRGCVVRGAGIQAPEEQLDHAPRELGGDESLGRGVERADVQRARVAQRGARGARRKRLVHVNEVQRERAQQLLDRASHVHRHRSAMSRRRPRDRQRLPHRQHRDPGVRAHQGVVAQQRIEIPVGAPQRPPRPPHRLLRPRRRDDQNPMPPGSQQPRRALDERVDLMLSAPGMGRDVRDREPRGHHAEHRPASRSAPADPGVGLSPSRP